MTLDELVELTEAIIGDLTIQDIRGVCNFTDPGALEAPQWALLVRFLGGERPAGKQQFIVDHQERMPVPDGFVWPADNPALLTPPPPPPERRPQRGRDVKQLELGGDFDGIVLP